MHGCCDSCNKWRTGPYTYAWTFVELLQAQVHFALEHIPAQLLMRTVVRQHEHSQSHNLLHSLQHNRKQIFCVTGVHRFSAGSKWWNRSVYIRMDSIRWNCRNYNRSLRGTYVCNHRCKRLYDHTNIQHPQPTAITTTEHKQTFM